MTFLANKLRERIQVLLPVNTPDDTIAGYVRTYQIQTTVWGESIAITSASKGIAAFAAYVRGTEVSEFATHIIKMRRVGVQNLGKEMSSGFSGGFNTFGDLNVLKSDYFLFIQRGSTVKGSLFKILGYEDVGSRREYLRLRVRELEEVGTGYSIQEIPAFTVISSEDGFIIIGSAGQQLQADVA